MRGSPLLRALFAFLILAALGWPLARLTRRGAAPPIAEAATPVEARPVTLAMNFTEQPTRVAVHHLGREVFVASVSQPHLEATIALPWPEEGIDLRFMIAWPEGSPLKAAEVRVTDPEGSEHAGSIFSEGPADQVLTFR